MNCPSCNRILASTLSVCPSCGTMIHDSVREELALKISPIVKTEQPKLIETPVAPIPPSPVVSKNPETSPIMNKATSQTLIEFQNKNATLPDWRLQLQNSVRKRLDNHKNDDSSTPVIEAAPRRATLITNGATALKSEPIEQTQPAYASNPHLAKALKRIEESRQKYLASDEPIEISAVAQTQTSVKQFPRITQPRPNDSLPKREITNNVATFIKPNPIPPANEIKIEKFDTNKLPPLPAPAKISSSFEKRTIEPRKIEIEIEEDDFLEIQTANSADVTAYNEPEEIENTDETEEIDDCAPISLRFNAALFDLLICSFLSLILLSPFMLLNGRFFSPEGFFAFLATCSIVMFIYLTTTVGFLGRSFGMRLFSLEIVDVEENAYPTLHQAAVSSSVYLLSLAFGGIGFITMLLNNEKRAAHDLLSGTIIVKEY